MMMTLMMRLLLSMLSNKACRISIKVRQLQIQQRLIGKHALLTKFW